MARAKAGRACTRHAVRLRLTLTRGQGDGFWSVVRSGGTHQTRGTTAHFVRLVAKVALPPKYRGRR